MPVTAGQSGKANLQPGCPGKNCSPAKRHYGRGTAGYRYSPCTAAVRPGQAQSSGGQGRGGKTPAGIHQAVDQGWRRADASHAL